MSDGEQVVETAIRGEVLKDLLNILRAGASESIVRVGRDGIASTLVGPSNVYLEDIEVHPAAFERVPDGQFAIGVNLERLADAISKAGPSDTVTLSLDTSTRMLNVEYGPVSMEIAGIDPDTVREEPDISDLDVPNRFTVEPSAWKDAVDTVNLVADHVAVSVDADAGTVDIHAKGDTDRASYTLDESDFISHEFHENTESLFNIDWVRSHNTNRGLSNAIGSAKEVTFLTGEEFPLRAKWTFAEGNANGLALIAPRITRD